MVTFCPFVTLAEAMVSSIAPGTAAPTHQPLLSASSVSIPPAWDWSSSPPLPKQQVGFIRGWQDAARQRCSGHFYLSKKPAELSKPRLTSLLCLLFQAVLEFSLQKLNWFLILSYIKTYLFSTAYLFSLQVYFRKYLV